MKKILIILTAVAALLFSTWGYFSMKSKSVSVQVDIYNSFPEIPASVLQINKLNEFGDALLYNNNYWLDLAQLSNFKEIHQLILALDSIKSNTSEIQQFVSNRQFVISNYPDKDGESYNLVSAQISDQEWVFLQEFLSEYLSDGFYYTYTNEVFLLSNSKELLTAAQNRLNQPASISLLQNEHEFMDVKRTTGKKAMANWFINLEKCRPYFNKWLKEENQTMVYVAKNYSKWCGFDLGLSEDKIIINGFASSKNTSDYINIFEGQTTGPNTLVKYMPYNTYFYYHLYLSDYVQFREQIGAFQQSLNLLDKANEDLSALETSTGESPNVFFLEHFDGEVAFGSSPRDEFVLISLHDEKIAKERLAKMADEIGSSVSVSEKNGIKRYHFKNRNGFASCIFGNFFSLEDEHIAITNNHMVIAPSEKFLSYLLSRNPKTQTFHCSPIYKEANKTLLSTSNHSMYIGIPYVVRNANKFFSNSQIEEIKRTQPLWSNFSSICMQTEAENNDVSYQQAFVQYDKKTNVSLDEPAVHTNTTTVEEEIANNGTDENETTEEPKTSSKIGYKNLFETDLEHPIRMPAQFFSNHYTGETEIIVQDTENLLYLINHDGKILWKVPLSEPIIGEIHMVDILKNRKLQMAFTTANKFFIIDRNGNNIKGSPIKLKSKASAGLAVFDYDNTKDYRFLIPTANKKVLLFKRDLSQPRDWAFDGSKTKMNQAMQTFRIDKKDFLVAADAKQVYFLNRKGKNRLIPESNIIKSKRNKFFTSTVGSRSRFITTDETGKIHFFYLDKEVLSTQLKWYEKNHLFDIYKAKKEDYYIFFDKNGIDIFDEELNNTFSNEDIKGGEEPFFSIYKETLSAYNAELGEISLIDLSNFQLIDNAIPADNSYFNLGRIKPYKENCIVCCDGTKLSAFSLNISEE